MIDDQGEPSMSNAPTVSVREWTDLVRRARLGKTTKYVALMLATYADYRNGCRIRPGRSRLAWESEVDKKTVTKSLAELVRVGLIEVVRLPHGRDGAAEYRLIIGPDVLEHVDVPSPAEAVVGIGRLAEKGRGPSDATRGTGHVEPMDNRGRDPWDGPRLEDQPDESRPVPGATSGETRPVLDPRRDPPRPPHHPWTYTQTPSPNSGEDLCTAVTPTRATGPDQDPIPPPMPERCTHGLTSRRRADGLPSCAICRREATRPPPDNVVHLRPRTA
jgi:hypothetical protein